MCFIMKIHYTIRFCHCSLCERSENCPNVCSSFKFLFVNNQWDKGRKLFLIIWVEKEALNSVEKKNTQNFVHRRSSGNWVIVYTWASAAALLLLRNVLIQCWTGLGLQGRLGQRSPRSLACGCIIHSATIRLNFSVTTINSKSTYMATS